MVLLTRHEDSIRARLCFAFSQSTNQSFYTSIFSNSFFTQAIFSHWFPSLFATHLSSSSSFPKKLSKFSVFQTLFFCKWKFCRKQKCAISFHSLLPLPKRIQQGLIAWILFVSLFSLFQKNEGLTAWILLCLPSPF